MTKLAYLDCPTGIAGDMCLGALVDAGVPLDYLEEHLNRLGIAQEYRLWAEKVHRNGQQATKIHVEVVTEAGVVEEGQGVMIGVAEPHNHPTEGRLEGGHSHPNHDHAHRHLNHHRHDHHHGHDYHRHEHHHAHDHHPTGTRHLPEIEAMIVAAKLPPNVETWSLAVFRQLAEAEGAVHGIAAEQVHFHEVGATDAIVDIVGTCLGLDWLGIDKIFCSALPTGSGTIWTAHGHLPVPAPAVLKLFELRQIPLYSNGIDKELVTPTGAAIATTLAAQFGPPPSMTLLRVGLGAGSIDLPLPNILRLWIGEQSGSGKMMTLAQKSSRPGALPTPSASPALVERGELSEPDRIETVTETITTLETQVDDLNPQAIGYLYDLLFTAGALDVFTQTIGMKKSRLGTLLTVICHPQVADACEAILFRETTTLGVRRFSQQRHILHREIQPIETEYGTVRVKVAWSDQTHQAVINVQPEYEDCAAIARQQQLPWREVHRIALATWHREWEKAKGKGEKEYKV